MTPIDVPVVLPWMAFLLIWVIGGLVVVAANRLLRSVISQLVPDQRALLLFALAVSPVVLAALVVLLGFSPFLGGLIVGEHCHAATGCDSHVPSLATMPSVAIFWAIAIMAATGVVSWLLATMLRRSLALSRMLESFAGSQYNRRRPASTEGGGSPSGFAVIESEGVFAYCAGLLRGRVLVSRGLLDSLGDDELDAVLAHEHAHEKRRDNLRRFLVGVSLWPLPRRWRRGLVQDLDLATESACDTAAVRFLGNTDVVANAIRAVAVQARTGAAARPRVRALNAAVMTECSPAAVNTRIVLLYSNTLRRLPGIVIASVMVSVSATSAIAVTRLAHHLAEFLIG